MGCASAEELQARLILRGLWPSAPGPATEAEDAANAGEALTNTASPLQQQLRAEVDGILSASLARRRKRLEAKVELLAGGSGASGACSGVNSVSLVSLGVQTMGTAEAASTELLTQAFVHALKGAAAAVKPPPQTFGPSKRQRRFEDPPEKPLEPTPETPTLSATLESLDGACSSRVRQIAALKQQLAKCQKSHEEHEVETKEAARSLQQLIDSPSCLKQAHGERREHRQGRVDNFKAQLSKSKEQAEYFQTLAQQQRVYFLQSERVAVNSGPGGLSKHPAGCIWLMPEPLPMNDEEKLEVWDVGSAVANPYVCDSWPFEPNVMASRCPKEAYMQPFVEETQEDLDDENMRLNPFRPNLRNLRLPVQGGDDSEDDGYQGPTGTSRSL
mmetsp:Transcript_96626/g.207324  ORF Transcript_96626/g.207324 Transcript_96626/m.207324 type:complete len:387 (-) Transcript_96626:97-1257(-)